MSVSAMKKLTVLAYSADADAIVRRLMRLRCVDIRNAGAGEGLLPLQSADADAKRAESERRIATVKRAIPYLAKYTTRRRGLRRVVHRVDRTAFLNDGRADRAISAAEQAVKVAESIDALVAERTQVLQLLETLTPWLGYDAPLGEGDTKRTVTQMGSYPAKTDAASVRAELEAAGAYVEVVAHDDTGLYLFLTSLREDAAAVERTLVSRGFLKITFPEPVVGTARAAYDKAEERAEKIECDIFAAEETLRDLSEQLDEIEILYDVEATNITVALQKRKLAATETCVVIEGWVPAVAEEAVADALQKFECACEIAEPDGEDEPPVLLKNNKWAVNFEWVLGMYSYPKYGSFDPTFIMSIFYFIIFGLMFADVGYGLLLVACCFGGVKLLNPKPGMRRMLVMFGLCGISCTVMGVLFGGWFGNLPTAIMNSFIYHADGVAETTPIGKFFSQGIIFNPIDSSTSFLVLSLAMGEIHLIAGMAVNMIETCKKGRVLEAICTTVPFWVLFLGIDLLAPSIIVDMFVADPASISTSVKETFALLSVIGKYILFASFGLILLLNGVGQKRFIGWLSKGLGGLYSLIGLASDILSYSRILALGLVASVVAQVVNMMTNVGEGSIFGFVFMLIVMILGHALNLAINLLGTFVHAARLQYIEFFGKFFEDGGELFTPALPVEEYTEELLDEPN